MLQDHLHVRLHTQLHKRDFYAGGLMTLLGAAVTLDAGTYDLGTLVHMGPGMFPLMLGVVLTFIGILIFGTALVTPLGEDEHILPKQKEWRGWGCIIAGPVLFIIFGHYFGMAPATFMCVFVSALGEFRAIKRDGVWSFIHQIESVDTVLDMPLSKVLPMSNSQK